MPPRLFADYSPRTNASSREPLPAGLIVREARAGDAQGIAFLLTEREGSTPKEAVERAQGVLRAPPESNATFVAQIGSKVIGYGRAVHVRDSLENAGDAVPQGWYLIGVIVTAEFRRRGIGTELTRHRLNWISQRADVAYFFANSINRPSIDLHRRFGFEEIRRPFKFPNVTFSGAGVGVLFRINLRG